MPKVSFRMASASREWVFGVQTNTARKNSSVRPHRGPVDHRAKRMLRTEGNGHRHTPSVQHSCGAPEGARSRKPRPVLCLGNRALNGRPTGDAEVGVARCPVTERLVGSDAVVDVAEAGGLHRKRSAVIDGCAVEVLVFEGAEETLDDAVSLRLTGRRCGRGVAAG